MNDVTNNELYLVLLGIKEDIGGLKSSVNTQVKTLEGHDTRIGKIENSTARRKGAMWVWGLLATGAASVAGTLTERLFHH